MDKYTVEHRMTPPASMNRRAPIGMVGLLALIFLTVSGGPYGIEPAVSGVGGAGTMTLLVLVPLVWCLPVSLMAAELCAALPLLGGYYRWVREAMGAFWGFQEGWWSWLFTWVDMPLYPALAGELLRQSWPLLTGHELSIRATLGFVLGFIWLAGVLNWAGARVVSDCSILCSLAVLAPFVAFILVGWHRPAVVPPPTVNANVGTLGAWGLALSTVIWNYSGWDNVATYAPSVYHPQRTYPLALGLGVLGIMACYLGPVAVGLRIDPNAAHWQNGYFVQLGEQALGARVALLMALTGVASAWAQYTSQLLYVIPLPVSLAQDGYLPDLLQRENRRGVASAALLLCTLLYSAFALAGFSRLLVVDVLLYSAGLALEFLALWKLRQSQPSLARPFRVPLRGAALAFFCWVPMTVAVVMLVLAVHEDRLFTLVALAMTASGPLLWIWLRRRPARAAVTATGLR